MVLQEARVAVTGATGLVGHAVVEQLLQDNRHSVRIAVRAPKVSPWPTVPAVTIEQLGPDTDWHPLLDNVDAVVHAAARVHMMHDSSANPRAEFFRVNVAGTLRLAEQAALCGVRRFIFISSIKVNGESTLPGQPFHADQPPAAADAYGQSKLEAEYGLLEIAERTGMQVVIIRPVLVYGPGVKANFLTMLRWVDRGIPLPLGSVDNLRSLVAVDNLVSLVKTCLSHPAAANQRFLVSDGDDVSTPELLRRLATALGRPSRLLPVAPSLLEGALALIGKRAIYQRIAGSLQVDINKTRTLLGWSPPVSMQDALASVAADYLERKRYA